MRTGKKILSILLAALMLAGCFSLMASAITVVSSIELTCPVPAPDGAFPTTEDVESASTLKVNSIYIYEVQGSTSVKATAPFEAGKSYEIDFTVATRFSNYNFDTNLSASVNGGACTAVYLNRSTANVVWTVTVSAAEDQRETVHDLSASVGVHPFVGAAIYDEYGMPKVGLVCSTRYSPNVIKAYVLGANGSLTEPAADAVFESEKTYVFDATVGFGAWHGQSWAESYKFSPDLQVRMSDVQSCETLTVTSESVLFRFVYGQPKTLTDPNDPRLPTSEPQTYEIKNGLYCGSYEAGNCRWTYDPATGELIFYATGENATVPPAMEDYDLHAPYDFLYDVKSIYIDEGIKHIGYGAFVNMISVRTLTLPASIEDDLFTWADSYGNVTRTPLLMTLSSLETLVIKSKAFDDLEVGDYIGFPVLFENQPILDVNEKRALMEIRSQIFNTVAGYHAYFDLNRVFEEGDMTVLQPLVDAANAKYHTNLPAVTTEEIAAGYFNLNLQTNNLFVIPPYFKLICANDAAARDAWAEMEATIYQAFQDRIAWENERMAPDQPQEIREDAAAKLEQYESWGDIRPAFENAVTDIATYPDTKPSTYMDRRAANLTVTANASAGGSATGGGKFFQNETATLTATPNSGYHFTGWFNGDSKVGGNASYSFSVNSDVTLTAQFEKDAAPDNPNQPGQPDNPGNNGDNGSQPQGKVCKYCGGTHTGFPGVLIGFFHSILALFGLRKK